MIGRTPPAHERQMNSIAEAANILAVSERTVRRLIKRGELGAVHANRRVLIPRRELEDFVARGGTRP